MTIEIPLSKRGKNAGKYVAIVDDCDSDLALLNWTARKDRDTCYASAVNPESKENSDAPTLIHMHRVILSRMLDGRELGKHEFVDHIDGNGLNNQRSNLRRATKSQNKANSVSKTNKTGFKGVYKKKYGYQSQIVIKGRKIQLGSFKTPELAHEAYKEAAIKYHGDFANDGHNPLLPRGKDKE